MKRTVALVLLICILTNVMSGCGRTAADDGVYSIVCTTFPIYDWVNNVIGENSENTEVTLLLDNGVDMHSFQPGAREIALVSSCDLLIYVGGESDAWIEDAISEAVNKNQTAISLIELLGDEAKEESDAGLATQSGHKGNSSEETGYDEHVWLSLRNAQLFVSHIAEAVSEYDEANKTDYEANARAYCERLAALDENARERLAKADGDTIIVADRFAFIYLMADYGINYYAAFPGCSAETEASFEVVVFMSEKLDETGLEYVVVSESADYKITDTIIENTRDKNQEIVVLDSMQTVTTAEYEAGKSYYGIMEDNLDKLVTVLE